DLRHVAVAGIVVAIGVGDADDRPVQRVVGIAHRLDEGLAQEQRESGVTVRSQSLAQSVSHGLRLSFLLVIPGHRAAMNPESRDCFTHFEIPGSRPAASPRNDAAVAQPQSMIRLSSPSYSMLQ